jgi:hypothetical protein
MKYIALGNVIIFVGDLLSNGMFSQLTYFSPALILRGQIWRLVTFLFVPVSTGGYGLFTAILFFALSTLFYYWIGNALERQWGTTRFTVFYGLGVLLNIAAGFALYAIASSSLRVYYGATADMYYVNMSMFFAFATLFPDMQVLLYGILPLKVKWLAWIDAGLFAIEIVGNLISGQWVSAVLPLVALLNYFLFFWDDLNGMLHRGRDRAAYRSNAYRNNSYRSNVQHVNFKKAQQDVKQQKGYLHKCAVCGITDADDPNMEFRYCSKCKGYYCYCMNHINNHVHVQ